MPTASNMIQSLLDELVVIYSYEKKASQQLAELKSDGHHFRVKQGLVLEAEENQRQCKRLEALFELLRPIHNRELSEDEMLNCFNQSLDLIDRFTSKHRAVGYDTSMLVAEVMGRTDILKTLQFCMRNEVTKTTRESGIQPVAC